MADLRYILEGCHLCDASKSQKNTTTINQSRYILQNYGDYGLTSQITNCVFF